MESAAHNTIPALGRRLRYLLLKHYGCRCRPCCIAPSVAGEGRQEPGPPKRNPTQLAHIGVARAVPLERMP